MARHQESEEELDAGLTDSTSPNIQSEEQERVEESIERGKKLREEGKYEEGISELVDALKLDVCKDRIYYRLGNLYFDAEDLDRAEHSYKRAIEENKNHVNAQHNLSVVYRKQGRVNESIKQRKKAKKIEMKKPKNPDLTEEEKNYAKRFAVKLLLLIVGGIAGIGLIVYLISRFFF